MCTYVRTNTYMQQTNEWTVLDPDTYTPQSQLLSNHERAFSQETDGMCVGKYVKGEACYVMFLFSIYLGSFVFNINME